VITTNFAIDERVGAEDMPGLGTVKDIDTAPINSITPNNRQKSPRPFVVYLVSWDSYPDPPVWYMAEELRKLTEADNA
jgi:hypothetical protein